MKTASPFTRLNGGGKFSSGLLSRPVRRVYIVGGEGSGKTTFANQIHDSLGLTVHQLDYVAWRGAEEGTVPLFDPRYQPPTRLIPRPVEERLALIEEIAAKDSWVAEGKHLWWTEGLLPQADLVVWLDHVPFPRAASRVMRRAARSGGRSFRTHRGRRKFTRFRDYARHGRSLFRQLRNLLLYYVAPPSSKPPDLTDYWPIVTRSATQEFLRPYADKVVSIKRTSDLDALIDALSDSSGASSSDAAER